MASTRLFRLALLALVTAAVAVAAWAAAGSVAQYSRAKAQTARAQAELADLRTQLPALEQRETLARSAETVRTRLEKSGWDPALWSNRKVQQSATVLSRPEAEKLLRQFMGADRKQWFSADKFSVAVQSPQAGLFSQASPDDKGFAIEISGTLHFPMGAP